MTLRASMLLAGLFAGILHGQTTAPAQPAGQGSNGAGRGSNSARPGAAPTRATGLAPTSPSLSGTGAGNGPLGNANGINTGSPATNSTGGNGGNGAGAGASDGKNHQPPAPAANARVEVTGHPSANRSGSTDRPLLPIVTAGNGLGIRSGTPIQVRLRSPIDSGHVRNGDMIDATLAAPVGRMPAGAPVRLTVVQSAPAGRLTSYGELSIQVVSIADRSVLSDIITAQGKEGPKEVPDAAPGRGTEAMFGPDQTISLPAS